MSAQDNLSRAQFREAYPDPGTFDIPVKHLGSLRIHPLYHGIHGLAEDIAAHGQKEPIQVIHEPPPAYAPNDPPGSAIADGHHRLAVLKGMAATAKVNVWSERDVQKASKDYRSAGYKGGAWPWERHMHPGEAG